jgi:hypothetical protein
MCSSLSLLTAAELALSHIERIFNYGDRGEIASIQYTAPDGVLAAATVRFGYDSIGRRKSAGEVQPRIESQQGDLSEIRARLLTQRRA